MNDLYQETILDELRNPQNYGVLPQPDVTNSETNASCGDEVTVFITYSESKKEIAEVSWTGTGCAISQVAMSLLSQEMKNMPITDIEKLTQADMENLLGITDISIGRVKCLLLSLTAVKKALL